MKEFFEEGFRFDRTRCLSCGGACCKGKNGHVIIGDSEAWVLSDFLDFGKDEFLQRYTTEVEGITVLADGSNDCCVFLEPDGKCTVYPARPLQCRTYPFWPANFRSPEVWNRTTANCPAIGRGEKYVLREILALVWLHASRYGL